MNHSDFAIPFGISTCSSLATSQHLREKTLPFTKPLYKYLKISPCSNHQIVPNCFPPRWIDFSQVFCLSWVFRRVYQTKQTTPHPRDTTVEPMAPWSSSPNEVWNSMRRLIARGLREPSSWVPRSYEERTSPNLTDQSFWDGFLGFRLGWLEKSTNCWELIGPRWWMLKCNDVDNSLFNIECIWLMPIHVFFFK